MRGGSVRLVRLAPRPLRFLALLLIYFALLAAAGPIVAMWMGTTWAWRESA